MSTEKDFQWTDDDVLKFVTYTLKQSPLLQGRYADLQDFKKGVAPVRNKDYEVMSGTQSPYPAPLEIHSVKRISDEEIFSVGDLTDIGNKIISFTEHQGCLSVLLEGKDKHRWGTNLASIEKAKPAILFKTIDSAPVYVGQKVYGVDSDFDIRNYAWAKEADYDAKISPSIGVKYFSTKEAAENYVINMKPCLSYLDIKKWLGNPFINDQDINNKLKELVKEKLQK